jgi:L-lysine exporter family protein LysE/ArgO
VTVFLSGLGLGFSLIVAIGAQNAFVLRQGLRNEHIFWVCLLCALSDAILMILGVLFFDKIRSILPWVETVLRIAGTIYLLWYALNRFRAAFSETAFLQSSGGETAPLLATLTSSAMLTWLNPHVYIDTVILVGSVASGFGVARWYFASGAISASFLFFFALGYGAKGLSGVLGRPTMWRMIDGAIGVLLFVIAYQLLEPLLI